MSGARVWPTYLSGDIAAIRNYCETDVLNTYLIYLRFELTRGAFDATRYEEEVAQVEAKLEQSDRPHLKSYLDAWTSLRRAL